MKTTAKIALIVAGGVALGTSVAAISASQAGGWGKHGGKGSHMVYVGGMTDHRIKDVDLVDHLVAQIGAKAAEIEADRAGATPAAAE